MNNLSLRFVRVYSGNRLVLLAALLSVVFAGTSWASLTGAVTVSPGTSQFIGLVSGGPGSLLASQVIPYSYSTTAGTTSGNLVEAVYRESGGTLDFYYQIDNSPGSATAIARETDTNFVGFTVAAGFEETGFGPFSSATNSTSGQPETADVNLAGTVVGFTFNSPNVNNVVAPGTNSAIFVISTNAQNFTVGNASIIDGGTQTVAAWQPTSAVPEPSYSILLGGGMLLLAGLRRKLISRR